MVLVPVAVAYIGGKYLIKEGDEILEATKEEYDNAIEQGAIIVESFADLIGDLGESIAEGTLGVIRGAGVAILDASQATYSYISSKVADRRVEAVAVTWAMTVYGLTAFTIFNRIRKA
tara:strand:+ start:180 stop:533 length:354 start_codon:yes stop_codon:yes gene_type:complete